MQQQQIHLRSPSDLIELRALKTFAPNLVFVFGSPEFFTQPIFVETLHTAVGKGCVVGCSTAGEIIGSTVHEKTAVVHALRFDHPDFFSTQTTIQHSEDSHAAGVRLAKGLNHANLHTVLLLSPGLDVNGSGIIEGLQSVLGKAVTIIGGLAGDNGAFSKTYTLHEQHVDDRQLVAVGFHGDHLHCAHGSFGGWQAFGPPRRVTRAVNNQLFSLDNESALDVYKRYLGDYAKDLPGSGLLFPFAVLGPDHQQTGLIRTILGIDDTQGSLTLAGDIAENSFVRLMHASTDALIDGAQAAAEATQKMLQGEQPGWAFLVSCVGRRMVMGVRVDEEVEAVADTFGANSLQAGFYSYGEVSPFLASTDCKLHNQTMTISYFYET